MFIHNCVMLFLSMFYSRFNTPHLLMEILATPLCTRVLLGRITAIDLPIELLLVNALSMSRPGRIIIIVIQ